MGYSYSLLTFKILCFVSGIESPAPTTTKPQPQVRPLVTPQVKPQAKPQAKPKAQKHKKKMRVSQKSQHQTETRVWVEGQTDDGHTYYYNTVTGGGDRLFDMTNGCQRCFYIFTHF